MLNKVKQKEILGFDIIKILAATLIVFHHYQQVFKVQFLGINFFDGAFNFSYLVELFFMISGFLMLYTHDMQKKNYCKVFLRKLLRIYPIVTLAFITTLLVKSVASEQLDVLWNTKAIISNLFLLFSGYPYFSMTGVNNPTWYLCILIQCYVVFYIMMWLMDQIKSMHAEKEKPLIPFCLILIFGSVLLNFLDLIPVSTFRGIESLFLGVLLCAIHSKIKKSFRFPQKIIYAYIVLMIVVACVIQRLQSYILVFCVYPAIVLMAYSMEHMHYQRLIRYASQVSFEVFVWHYPIMAFEQMLIRLTGVEINRTYFTMIAFTAFSWIVSWCIHTFVERPMNQWVRQHIPH